MKSNVIKAMAAAMIVACLVLLLWGNVSPAQAETNDDTNQGVVLLEQCDELIDVVDESDASSSESTIEPDDEPSGDMSFEVQSDKEPIEVTATDLPVVNTESSDHSDEIESQTVPDEMSGKVVAEARTGKSPTISYRTRVQGGGWQGWKKNGAASGTSGRSLRLEGIRVRLSGKPVSGNVQYRAFVQGGGWQGWKKNGATSGSSGKSKRVEAVKIKLTGNMAKRFDVYYRVHAQGFGWMGWAKNGASAGTEGYSYRLEAIQVALVSKGGKAPSANYKGAKRSTKDAFRKKAKPITLKGKYDSWKTVLPAYWAGRVKVYRYDTYYGPRRGEQIVVMPKGRTFSKDTWHQYYLLSIYAGPIDGYMNHDTNTRTAKFKTGQKVTIYHEDYGSGAMRFVELISSTRNVVLDVSTPYYAPNLYRRAWSKDMLDEANALTKLQKSGKHNGSMSDRESGPLTCLKNVAARTSIW